MSPAKTRLAPLIPIAGTHADDDPWWLPGSPLLRSLPRGLPLFSETEPFEWTTDLDGVGLYARKHTQWQLAGTLLRYYVKASCVPTGERVQLFAHSHGGQVAAYAAAQGMLIDTLVMVGTPVRWDMMKVYSHAKRNIRRWVLVSSPFDWWQILGELCGGRFGLYRTNPFADRNLTIEAPSHHALLDVHWWKDGLWTLFTQRKGGRA